MGAPVSTWALEVKAEEVLEEEQKEDEVDKDDDEDEDEEDEDEEEEVPSTRVAFFTRGDDSEGCRCITCPLPPGVDGVPVEPL